MIPPFTIAGRAIGADHPPYVIAEMSGNHNGDINRALALIEAAKAAGADAVKMQTYTADTLTIAHDGPGFVIEGGLWHGRTLHDLYQEAHTPWEWHAPLFQRARELGITIFSTPFDASAIELLESLDAPAYKIASFEAIDLPLIEKVAATGKPLIISTGLCDLGEISEAVATARRAGCMDLALLHCVSGYPAPANDANVATIPHLAQAFNVVAGLSDHTLGTAVPVAAVAQGARIIEKHFTLSRSDGGPDAAFSLEQTELATMVADCRTAWQALGRVSYDLEPSEAGSRVFRRSLYVVRDVAAGERIEPDAVRSIRPGHGLAPKHLHDIVGSYATRDLHRGEPLSWDMVSNRPSLALSKRNLRLPLGESAFLRPICPDDVDDGYVRGLNDPQVNAFLVAARTTPQTHETISTYVQMNWDAPEHLLFGLFVDGRLRGTVRLHDIDHQTRTAWMGIALYDRSIWGYGWGKRSLGGVCTFARDVLGLGLLRAGIEHGNSRSEAIFGFNGFLRDLAGEQADKSTWILKC